MYALDKKKILKTYYEGRGRDAAGPVPDILRKYQIESPYRSEFFKQAESIIIHETPCVFFWHRNDYVIRQHWIKNYKVYPIYNLDKGNNIDIRLEVR